MTVDAHAVRSTLLQPSVPQSSVPPSRLLQSKLLPSRLFRSKPVEWICRYAPCELAGTVSGLASAWAVYALTDSLVAAAVAGTLGDGIGYYGVASWRAIRDLHRRFAGRRGRLALTLVFTLWSIVLEFGAGEIVGTLFVRPGLLLAMPQVTGDTMTGWFAGQMIANVVFYALTITSFELTRRRLRMSRQDPARPADPEAP